MRGLVAQHPPYSKSITKHNTAGLQGTDPDATPEKFFSPLHPAPCLLVKGVGGGFARESWGLPSTISTDGIPMPWSNVGCTDAFAACELQ